MIEITHTAAEGTLITGTHRGDGTAAILKTAGCRWSGKLGCWYVPRSRDQKPDTRRLTSLAATLTEAGHAATATVDDTTRPLHEIEADRADRSEQRTARLEARAGRLDVAGDASYQAYRAIADRIPLGQPVLSGHHSAPRHRRDLARMDARMSKSVQAHTAARDALAAAEASAAHLGARYAPRTVANRILKLEADARRLQAMRDGTGFYAEHGAAHGAYRDELNEQRRDVEERLTYWRAIRDEQQSTGAAPTHDATTVHVGDSVNIRGLWRTVVRVNRTTVSVATGYTWTDRAPWHEVDQVRHSATCPSSAGE